MKPFVAQHSIVRKIWGESDTILFIFAGAAAEFALNKAVDWLYFTGKLLADPIGRLFSTVSYAHKIVFSTEEQAHKAIDTINKIHGSLENKRGNTIPDWAYKDVLYMLIDYSIIAYELLKRKLSEEEKEEVFAVFLKLGLRMNIPELPNNFRDWEKDRLVHLKQDLKYGDFTKDLFIQYHKHLGNFRYFLLKEVQKMICPTHVKKLLKINSISYMRLLLEVYKVSSKINADVILKSILLPKMYKKQIEDLDVKDLNVVLA